MINLLMTDKPHNGITIVYVISRLNTIYSHYIWTNAKCIQLIINTYAAQSALFHLMQNSASYIRQCVHKVLKFEGIVNFPENSLKIPNRLSNNPDK